jgi:hypothetical protein
MADPPHRLSARLTDLGGRTMKKPMDGAKSTEKSKRPGRFKKGELHPDQGRGPAKGAPNAGRPPDLWRAKLREMASRDEVMQHVESVLFEGPGHPFFSKALDYATEHGFGKASQPHQISGLDGGPVGIALSVKLIDPPADV